MRVCLPGLCALLLNNLFLMIRNLSESGRCIPPADVHEAIPDYVALESRYIAPADQVDVRADECVAPAKVWWDASLRGGFKRAVFPADV